MLRRDGESTSCPALLVFLGTGAQCQHRSVPLEIDAQHRKNHGRIRLAAMPHGKMDAIQVDDDVVPGRPAALAGAAY